jgi:hypothetical protein
MTPVSIPADETKVPYEAIMETKPVFKKAMKQLNTGFHQIEDFSYGGDLLEPDLVSHEITDSSPLLEFEQGWCLQLLQGVSGGKMKTS